MPNVQSISFNKTGTDADLQAQQAAIQRQQMMAEMLRTQAAQPLEQQTVSGRVVPISGFQAIAKVLQSGLGGYMQKKGDEQQQELGTAKAKRSADMLRSLFNPTGTAAPADAQLSSMPQASTPGMQMSNPAAAEMTPEQQRAAIAYQIDPELGRSLMTNMFNQTNEQKNNAAEGLDPRMVGALRTGKMRADAMTTLQPGTTTLDLASNTERFMPKLGEGIMPTQDGGAQAVPGYGQAASGIAGQTAQAQAASNAGFQLKEITGPDGQPRLVTAQQAAQMAGGAMPPGAPAGPAVPGMQGQPPAGPPNMGFPPNTPVPPPTPGGQSRMDILQQERQQIMARPDTDLRKAGDMAAITREIAGAGGAQPAAAAPGIALQSDAQREAQVGAERTRNAVDESLAKQLPQERKDRQMAVAKGEAAIALIDKAMNHPGLSAATGLRGTIDPRNYIPGTEAKGFQTLMDQVGGQTFLQAYEGLRGGGQITEVEGAKASNAIARLNRSQSTDEFKASLNDFKTVISQGLKRAKGMQDSIDVARDKLAPTQSNGLTPAETDELAQLRKRLGR